MRYAAQNQKEKMNSIPSGSKTSAKQFSLGSPSEATVLARPAGNKTIISSNHTVRNVVRNELDDITSEEEGFEIFKFDRNSLKLQCEKICPKQIKVNEVVPYNPKQLRHVKIRVKASNTSSSSSSSDSDSDSSSASTPSTISSLDLDLHISSVSSTASSGNKSSSSSASNSSGSDLSDSEDETNTPNESQGTDPIQGINGTQSTSSNNTSNLETQICTDDLLVQNAHSSETLDQTVLEDEDEDSDESKMTVENLMKNRNKERKNSRWGDYVGARKSTRLPPKTSFCNKKYEAQIKKRLRMLLKKDPSSWTEDDRTTMQSFPKLVEEVEKSLQSKEVASERLKESEDTPELLEQKCAQLSSVISKARYLIIYTGAGISTSAKIPDYRGPRGIWTRLQKGEEVTQSLTDISQTADPTLTHMAIKELYDRGIAKHIVSQNVDGLHLRSGIPKTALSEVHGNMYVEVCVKCTREFVRLFDVTEQTRRYHHKTGRFCYYCGQTLQDSVVLFGEKGSLRWPLNWTGAEYHVDKADVILCLGSSLKVLRRYPWLWCMSKPAVKRPDLYIVNLQWTPKDQFAKLKINGKCDEVMSKVMANLKLPISSYMRQNDSIFTVATTLHSAEIDTKSSVELSFPSDLPYPEKNKDLRNYIRFEPIFRVPIPYSNSDTQVTEDKSEETLNETDTNSKSVSNVRKRPLKGNNSSWLGNAVVGKQQKKRKLK